MKCTKAHKLMSASLDGELSASEQELLAAHLKQCVACGKEYHAFQEMHRLLHHAQPFSAPPYLASRVMARLDTVETRPFFSPLWANFAEALMIFMVIGIGVASGNLISNSMGLHNFDDGLASMSLEIFDATPPESLGGAYLAMLEVSNEK
ncbi:MAG: zf-HC2 domain-containing protein [Desulfobulbaceae bacterium]|nr:zf-HC2 domain-containing protein [Desulfobulbaceae bacterium]